MNIDCQIVIMALKDQFYTSKPVFIKFIQIHKGDQAQAVSQNDIIFESNDLIEIKPEQETNTFQYQSKYPIEVQKEQIYTITFLFEGGDLHQGSKQTFKSYVCERGIELKAFKTQNIPKGDSSLYMQGPLVQFHVLPL